MRRFDSSYHFNKSMNNNQFLNAIKAMSINPFECEIEKTNTEKLQKLCKICAKIIENELTDKQRECVKMYFYDNLNTVEIASILNINNSTVCRNIQRGKKRIEKILKYYFE